MAKYSKLKRIYLKQELIQGVIIEITDEKFLHLKTVLRLRQGEEFRIFNDINGEYIAKIVNVSRRSIQCQIKEQFRKSYNRRNLTIAIAVIKQDKFIDAVRGAVQLGVTKIIPVMMENSQNIASNALNKNRIERCIVETCEQCESIIIPTLHDTISLDELLTDIDADGVQLYIADEQAKEGDVIGKNDSEQIILIGPEGGISDNERTKLFQLSNVTAISLGENVLRAEIATISAITIIQYLNRIK